MSASSSFPSATRSPLIVLFTDAEVQTRDDYHRWYIGPFWHIVTPASESYDSTLAQRTAPIFPGQLVKTAEELGLDDAVVLKVDGAMERAWDSNYAMPSPADLKILAEDRMAITRAICAWYRRRSALIAWAAQNRA